MSYVDRVIEQVKAKDPEQPEFIQAVTEVLKSLEPVIESNPPTRRRGCSSASSSRSASSCSACRGSTTRATCT